MIFTPRLDEAIKLAARLHRAQSRNDSSSTPYVSHLISVAILVAGVTSDEDVIIAALMHDSLEDVPHYSYEQLVTDCGKRVADIVTHVTEPLDANKTENDQLPWLERKEAYLANLRSGGVESAIVSLADKVHNTESFIRDYNKEGDSYAARFHSSIKNRLWFHEQVLAIAREKLGNEHTLVTQMESSTDSFKKLIETV
jgi:(p)ppGpp synthase/HD superfamily hydrolase